MFLYLLVKVKPPCFAREIRILVKSSIIILFLKVECNIALSLTLKLNCILLVNEISVYFVYAVLDGYFSGYFNRYLIKDRKDFSNDSNSRKAPM